MKSSFLKKWACLLSIASLFLSLTAPAAFADENSDSSDSGSSESDDSMPLEIDDGWSDEEVTQMVFKYPPRLLLLQWGSLISEQKPATDWSGYVEVSKGALKIIKEVKFESNDTASVSQLADGRPGRVVWTSTINNGKDGLVFLFGAPNDATFTISTPHLGVQTFTVEDLVKGYYKRGIDVNHDGIEDDYDFKAIVKSPFDVRDQLFRQPAFLEMTVGCHSKDKNTCFNLKNYRSYSVTVSIGGTEVELHAKPFRMEKDTDSITSEKSGQSVTFEVKVGPFTDGIIARVKQTDDFDEEDISEDRAITVTVKEGDTVVLEKSFVKGDEFGQFAFSNESGHSFMISNRLKGAKGMSQSAADKYATIKENLSAKLEILTEKIDELLQNGTLDSDTAASLTELIDQLQNYNWDEAVQGDVENMLQNLYSLIKSQRVKVEAIRSALQDAKKQQGELLIRARTAKYQKKLIPFRDVDDSEWFVSYVQNMTDKKIVSGYEDATGNQLGEFRPGNQVTKAEILKMVLNTLGKDIRKSGALKHAKAASHWAKDYVRTAEGLNLSLVTDSNVDLDATASRGDVIRAIFEAMGVTPQAVSKTRFSDVTSANKNAAYIEYAAEMEIVSGDTDASGTATGTFRPYDSINRAEVSKILNNVMALNGAEI